MMTSSVGVAFLLLSLGVTRYVESVCPFETIRNAHTDHSNQLEWDEGASVLFTCLDGFATDDLQTSFMRTCTNGQWLPVLACNPIICTGLPQVEDADVLYLSTVSVTNDEYPFNSEAMVICSPGMSTERGRLRYVSRCTIRAEWDDTSPCSGQLMQECIMPIGRHEVLLTSTSLVHHANPTGVYQAHRVSMMPECSPVTIRPETSQFTRFRLQLTETSVPFNAELNNPESPAAQDLADSIGRALFTVFSQEFGGSFVGAENYMFSNSASGVLLELDMLFLPSVNFESDELSLRITSALDRVNYQATDPNDGTTYTFQRNRLDVALEPVSQFTREATIGLSIAGALVALLLFIAIMLCCCYRRNPKVSSALPPRQPRPTLASTVPQGPPPVVPSPYAQIADVRSWGLPRLS